MSIGKKVGLGVLLTLLLILLSTLNSNIEKRNARWKKEVFNPATPEWRLLDIKDSMMIDPQTVDEKVYKVLLKRLEVLDNYENLEDY